MDSLISLHSRQPSNFQQHTARWSGATDQVASGMLEGYTTSDPIEATSDRMNVVVGMNGLEALAAMGLTVKESEE